VIGAFSDGKSALMLIIAGRKYAAGSEWGRAGAWMCRCWTSDHADGRWLLAF